MCNSVQTNYRLVHGDEIPQPCASSDHARTKKSALVKARCGARVAKWTAAWRGAAVWSKVRNPWPGVDDAFARIMRAVPLKNMLAARNAGDSVPGHPMRQADPVDAVHKAVDVVDIDEPRASSNRN